MISFRHFAGALAAVAIIFAAAGIASASVAFPYTNNFTSDPTSVFTTGISTSGSSTASWAYENGSAQYFPDSYLLTLNRVNGASAYAYSSVPITGVPSSANSSFEIQADLDDLTDSVPATTNTTVGLRFLADTTNTNTNACVVDINVGNVLLNNLLNTGAVRAVAWNGGTATVDPTSIQSSQPKMSPAPTIGTLAPAPSEDTYLLQVFGYYDSGDKLDIQAAVYDVTAKTYVLNKTDLTPTHVTAPTGTNFGFFASTSSGSNSTITADFTNFSVTAVTPEPSTFVLLGAGAIGLAVCGLRRKQRGA
jgi:hypothetical protein